MKHVETTNPPGEPGPISLGARLLPTLCGACRSAGGGRPLCDTLEPGARRRRALDFRRPGRGEGTVARGAALGRIFSQPLFHPRHRWAKDGGHSFFFKMFFFPLCWWIIFSPQRLGDFVKLFLEFVGFKNFQAMQRPL